MEDTSMEVVRAALTPAEVREQRLRERDEELAARLLRRGDIDALADALTRARSKPKRARKANEPPEVAASIERQIHALVRRIGPFDVESLVYLMGLRKTIDLAITASMRHLHDGPEGRDGYSYDFIAKVLGVSRQAVYERLNPRVRDRSGKTAATVTPIRQETA